MKKKMFRGIRFLICTIGLFLFVLAFYDEKNATGVISGFSTYMIRNQISVAQYVNVMGAEGNDKGGLTYFAIKNFPLMQYVSNHPGDSQTIYAQMSQPEEDLILKENGLDAEDAKESEEPDESVQTMGPVSFIFGETYGEEEQEDESNQATETSATVAGESYIQGKSKIDELKRSLDTDYLIQNFYIVDGTTSVSKKIFNVAKMLKNDYGIQKDGGVPQILIYHTHGASEGFKGNNGGGAESIVEVGAYLAEVLKSQYGYQVIHDKTKYDLIDGNIDRNRAYGAALPAIRKTLEENPSIEVVIDLHRDGVGKDTYTYADIDGKKAAQIMFFNGMSRNKQGEIAYLENPYRRDNLSFSLQLKLAAMEKYPGLTKPIYLKGYRYNMHLAKRCLLIELGNQNNTKEEAINAIPALADVLNDVLTGS